MSAGGLRAYTRFWAAHATSWTGDAIALVALPLVVLEATGSLLDMGVVSAAGALGAVVSGPLSGLIVDRVELRRLMIVCDVVQLAVYGALAAAMFVSPERIGSGITHSAIAAVAIASVASGVARVASTTAVVELVDPSSLTKANGQMMSTFALAHVVGPAAGGLLVGSIGAAAAILVNALTFAGSALLIASIRTPLGRGTSEGSGLRAVVDGYRVLARLPGLRRSLALLLPSTILLAGSRDLFVGLLRGELGASETQVGIFFSVASVGTVAGGAAAHVLRRRFGLAIPFASSLVVQGVAALVLAASAGLAVALAVGLAFGFGIALTATYSATVRHEATPPPALGRVTAAYIGSVNVVRSAAALGLPAFGASLGIRPTLLVAGAMAIAWALWTYVAGARRGSRREGGEPIERGQADVASGADLADLAGHARPKRNTHRVDREVSSVHEP